MSMNSQPAHVSVIIATLADSKREACLRRAIDGVLAQTDVVATPIVVVNGQRFEANLVDELRQRSDVVLHQIPEAGLINARVTGCRLVKTPFFAFLDDDDEYLPHAIATRLGPLLADPRIDLAISNGFRVDDSVRSISAHNIADARERPFLSILENNWLTSAGGLYRTTSFTPEFFQDNLNFGEWTYLAFKLMLGYRVAFIENPSYVIHDTQGSLSKTNDYNEALAGVMAQILKLPLPSDVHLAVRRKYGAALHDHAYHCLRTGQKGRAFRSHLQSLLQPGGVGYLLFSRKFVGL